MVKIKNKDTIILSINEKNNTFNKKNDDFILKIKFNYYNNKY